MATALHKVVLEKDTVVDLFGATSAVPPIASGVAGYIQNISNREVELSNSASFESKLIIGGKTSQPAISTLTFEAGDTIFLRTKNRRAVLTVAVAV